MPESDPQVPHLYARNCIPVDVEHFVVNYPIIPLSTTPTTTSTTTTSFDIDDIDAQAVLASNVSPPPHLKLLFMPKVVRDGSTCRIIQLRFLKSKNKFVWMSFGQPLLYPDPSRDKPRLRLPAPSLDVKFDYEDMMNFTRFNNIESDGSYYRAAVGDPLDARGYGEFIDGRWKTDKSGKRVLGKDGKPIWLDARWKDGKFTPPTSSK